MTLIDCIKALINDKGFCFICKQSILDHTDEQILLCCDNIPGVKKD